MAIQGKFVYKHILEKSSFDIRQTLVKLGNLWQDRIVSLKFNQTPDHHS